MISLISKKSNKRTISRIFAAVMLLVWFGNSLPSLRAMTLPAENCQMTCCKIRDWHSATSCPIMSDSDEAMADMEGMTHEQTPAETYKDILVVAQPDDQPLSDSQDIQHFPFLKTKFSNICLEMAFITQGNSNSGQRQQQSSDNSILLSFATQPRPPTFVATLAFETRTGFIFADKIWSRQTSSRGPPVLFS